MSLQSCSPGRSSLERVSLQREIDIELIVNSTPVRRRVKARQHLGDFLREELELTGTHLGCEHGVCGACTVLVNGQTARSCLMLAVQASGKVVQTIEGMSDSGALADLQAAFAERNAAQCAYCTPGMLLTAYELMQKRPSFTRTEIREFISGNFCRCTGYEAIIDAIAAAAERRNAANARMGC
jgi:aerobic-type carbon monoxide dehydrogenase small subunit (CoxS/CutS family)